MWEHSHTHTIEMRTYFLCMILVRSQCTKIKRIEFNAANKTGGQ